MDLDSRLTLAGQEAIAKPLVALEALPKTISLFQKKGLKT